MSEELFQSLGYKMGAARRMELRRQHIIEPIRSDLAGARVLDLGAHDGRWAYLLADAGARAVEGIEGRPEMVEQFFGYPDDVARARVELHTGDLFEHLERRVAEGARFDVIACLGVLYHIMDHWRLLSLMRRLNPQAVVIDSEFTKKPWPHVAIVRERTDKKLNAVSDRPVVPAGTPSTGALEVMADSLGWSTSWVDWTDVPERERQPVGDYFGGKKGRIRATCLLRK